jgi:hypothetical protein
MMDLTLSVKTANSICKAYRIICESQKFDFTLERAICLSESINGAQIFAFPDDIRWSKFDALLKSVVSFTKKLAAVKLDTREMYAFVAEMFDQRAYAAEATRVVKETLSLLDTNDAEVIVALARLLEREMDKAMATIEVTITADMLEAKRRKLDDSPHQ